MPTFKWVDYDRMPDYICMMKHVSILVPESSVLASIGDPRYMFTAVNQFLVQAGKEPLFDVHLVAATKEVKLHDGQFSVHADLLLDEVAKTDLVFIPALNGNMEGSDTKEQCTYSLDYQTTTIGCRSCLLVYWRFSAGINRFAEWEKMFYTLAVCQ
ncbi:MAG: hypothetical protein V9E88_11095 [Ferruginibacter sp.]